MVARSKGKTTKKQVTGLWRGDGKPPLAMECHLPGSPTHVLTNANHKAIVRPLAASDAAHQPEEAVAPKWLTSQGKEKALRKLKHQ